MSVARKRVSWVELYLDLIFVLGVGRLAHEIVAEPRMRTVWIALGLFLTLWWTWIGFAVLYNRHGDDDRIQRLLFRAGSVPAGLAAVAIEPAAEGHSDALALSLAATRVVLAVTHAVEDDWRDGLRRRVSRAYFTSAALIAVSVALPGPWRYALWAIAIGVESGAVLAQAPSSEAEALDSHHFAERFGLFLIILLGEVVISAGNSPLAGEQGVAGVWAALFAAMVLGAALWWLYFDAAAELNLRVLELSGGSPAIARAIFAGGHMVPAFGLILTASGLGLLLEGHDPPRAAYWLACVGIGLYLAGTRVFLAAGSRAGGVLRVVLLIAPFQLARRADALSAHGYIWLLMAWTVMCAALGSLESRSIDPETLRRKVSTSASSAGGSRGSRRDRPDSGAPGGGGVRRGA